VLHVGFVIIIQVLVTPKPI